MTEEWRDIKGYEGLYRVSSLGNVESVKGAIKPTERKGYRRVELWKDGKRRKIQLHRLVAMAFISNPYGKPEVNHINCDTTDNRASNLEWVTAKENRLHSFVSGRFDNMDKPVLMDGCVRFESISKASRAIGANPNQVHRVIKGERKSVHGHTFDLAC